jgi:exoribonuclease-2
MESGNVVEFIDKQKILCAVVLEVRQQRLRLLTETNREVNLALSRVSHHSGQRLDVAMGRNRMVDRLKDLALRRKALTAAIDIRALWEVLSSEQEWIDLATMTAFCFPEGPTSDHESAVVRAFFENRLYFRFNHDSFFPHTEAQVRDLLEREMEHTRRQRIVEEGGAWLQAVAAGQRAPEPPPAGSLEAECLRLAKDYLVHGPESAGAPLARALTGRAGLDRPDKIFQVLVALGQLAPDANLDLLRLGITEEFAPAVRAAAAAVVASPPSLDGDPPRVDLTALPLMTIDGQATLDYDDALSVEHLPDGFRVGIHIADVGHLVAKGSPLDLAARERASSIYMPDQRIPMLPPELAEGICSLKAGEPRPAISTLVTLDRSGRIRSYDIVPSVVCVRHQRTYYDVNQMADSDPDIGILRTMAQHFRAFRLDQGAVQISLPDVGIWFDEGGRLGVSKVNRESPARLLVSELMIMANWLMARFLKSYGLAAIFRAQPAPRERLFRGEEGTLFQNWMQRRLLNRFLLGVEAQQHSGLGLEAYVTATSPIRKYSDLVTQRQVRAALGLEQAYPREEIEAVIRDLEQPMGIVARLQMARHRYWLLKYLEGRVGEREEAIVLGRRRNAWQVLLTNYMLECDLPPGGMELRPENLVQVIIQQANARRDVLTVFLGG